MHMEHQTTILGLIHMAGIELSRNDSILLLEPPGFP